MSIVLESPLESISIVVREIIRDLCLKSLGDRSEAVSKFVWKSFGIYVDSRREIVLHLCQ